MKIARTLRLSLAASLALAAMGSLAHAEDKKGNQPIEINITARPMRPSAVVDLGKILPEIEISKLRKDFYKQIEGLLLSEPF
jgi:hypothetical protein